MTIHVGSYFDKLIDIESKLVYSITEVQSLYSKDSYFNTNSLFRQLLQEANTPHKLYDYDALSPVELVGVLDSIGKTLLNENQQMQRKCDQTIEDLKLLL